MAHADSVRQVNAAFYRAFESLELAQMEAIWHRAPHIICIHPGWRPLLGWGPIMNSWEGIFASAFEVKVEVTEVQLTLDGGLAVIVVEETLTQRDYDGVSRATVLATNVFQLVGAQWKLILHHGSPVAMPSDAVPRVQ
ncbi:MAG TPA: nuclear transport factor 2 family protein [Candidatus Binataceae bacterium]|nr:nuclear transport factor 2 family protein [Candidatus Binataceae bacterium]